APPLARDLEVARSLTSIDSTTSGHPRRGVPRRRRSPGRRRARASEAVHPQLVAELADQRVDGRLDRGGEPLPRLEVLALDAVDGEPGGQPIQLPGKFDRVGDAERMCR